MERRKEEYDGSRENAYYLLFRHITVCAAL